MDCELPRLFSVVLNIDREHAGGVCPFGRVLTKVSRVKPRPPLVIQPRDERRFIVKKIFLVLVLTVAAAIAKANNAGAVYTATNSTTDNQVLIFDRAADGSLSAAGAISTGGRGLGTGLGNQSGITLTQNHAFLFVVNAGSDEISSLSVGPQGLTLADKVWSGGRRPISVTTHDNLLYVLNAGGQVGGSDNITGFSIGSDGKLTAIAGSTRPLSVANANPAQIAFNEDGTLLAVTEKGTRRIDTYTVDGFGVAHGPNVFPSAGSTPFGFNFAKRNQIVVSEAAGSAASSYSISPSGQLTAISSSVADHQAAACWLVVSNDGRYAYAANAASASVSGYALDPDGTLTLLNSDGRTGVTSPGPTDEALSANGRFLYTLNARSGAISVFSIRADGSLDKQADVPVRRNTNGFAAR
jgi:6-phosphogluconolactonase